MKKAIFALALLIAAGLGWFGWEKHLASEEATRALGYVKRASALLTQQASLERGEAGVTMREYLTRSASAIDDLDKGILEIRSSDWPRRPDAKDSAIEFLSRVRDGIRVSAGMNRTNMLASNAKDVIDAATKEAESSDNPYTKKLAYDKAQRAIDDRLEKLQELVKEIADSKKQVQLLVQADQRVKEVFGPDQGIELPLLQTLSSKS